MIFRCHVIRLVWFCWNSFTWKSWVWGHMLSLPIHQFTSTTDTAVGGDLTKKAKGKEGGTRLAGGQSRDPTCPTAAHWPYRSAGVEVEVMWLFGDLQTLTKDVLPCAEHRYSMYSKSTYEMFSNLVILHCEHIKFTYNTFSSLRFTRLRKIQNK